MKRAVFLWMIVLTFILSGCAREKQFEKPEYFGEYESETVYQKVLNIENCVNPEELVTMLEDIYGEKIISLSLEYDAESKKFKSPYEEFEFNVFSLYSQKKNKGTVTSDAFAFFMEYHESPVFIMDSEGSYLVNNYEVITTGENEYLHRVDAWSISDLYLCLHEYADCDGDKIRRRAYSNAVKSMAYYINFETRITNDSDNVNTFAETVITEKTDTSNKSAPEYNEEYVETYYISALEGAVITWQDNSTGEYEFVSKCPDCGRTGSSTTRGTLKSGSTNYGFSCTNSKCPLWGKSQQIKIGVDVKGDWVKVYR